MTREWKGELMGNSSEKRRNIAFNCVKRITLNVKDAEHLEDNRGGSLSLLNI